MTKTDRSGFVAIVVAVIGAGGVVAAAAISAALTSSDEPSRPTPSQVTGSPPSDCHPKIKIKTRPGQKISGPDGIRLTGTACGLGDEYGWLFDFDPYDGYYYRAGEGPVVTENGPWSFHDAPIGDPGDRGKLYSLTLVRASKECSDAILRQSPDGAGNVKYRAFPKGCSIDASITVFETWA
ncbi:hypothetical protein [Microbispora sp. NPDC049125]|uniref:hypothetical protein n=1 Tax=Microbispora sp. NPDC049125 TaxID=3154929 RepID=UPI003465F02C